MFITVHVWSIYIRRIFTDQAKQWLEQLKKEDVPVILCLTFADELYLHFIGAEKDNPDPTEFKRREIGRELEVSALNELDKNCLK